MPLTKSICTWLRDLVLLCKWRSTFRAQIHAQHSVEDRSPCSQLQCSWPHCGRRWPWLQMVIRKKTLTPPPTLLQVSSWKHHPREDCWSRSPTTRASVKTRSVGNQRNPRGRSYVQRASTVQRAMTLKKSKTFRICLVGEPTNARF